MATLAIGLLAAALADSVMRPGAFDRWHVGLGIIGRAIILIVASAYGDVLRGLASPEQARNVSGGLLLGVAILGGLTSSSMPSTSSAGNKRHGSTGVGT
jgi:hypothetical protein